MITQIAIVLFSAGSIFFLSGPRPIIGFTMGLLGQPFWMYAAWTSHQYGVLALSFWFTFCHARGIRRQWREIQCVSLENSTGRSA